ncbi:MAG: hypothetical protein WBL63_12505 [Candidatus Acidiferrum sp.]
MTKPRKTKEKMVQSTMRIPHSLWKRINQVAEVKRLSMAQTVERALIMYCYVNRYGDDEEIITGYPIGEIEWKVALEDLERGERERKGEKR